MLNSDLVATLRVFSKKEQHHLELFLQSPYCTNGKEAVQELKLVQHIFKALEAGEKGAPALTEESIYAVLHPDRATFMAQTVSNAAVSTLKLVRRFIVQEMSARSLRPTAEHTMLLQFFQGKGAFDLCKKVLGRLERERPEKNSLDNLDFLQGWQAETAKADFLAMDNELKGDFNLLPWLEALELFYLVERLNILMALFNRHRMSPVFEDIELQEMINEIDRWAGKPFFQHPVVQLGRMALLFLSQKGDDAEKTFDDFMAMLQEEEQNLSMFYLKWFESVAYNFCVPRFDQPKYRKLLFWLFHRRLLPERQNPKESIHSTEFLSMVKTAILGEQYELAKSFADTYRYRIKGRQSSEDYYQLGLALYYFQQKRFDEARSNILSLNFHETLFKYIFKTLEIKIFFETGEEDYELVESRLGTMKVAVHRDQNSMSEDKVMGYRNFVNIMLRLNHWRIQPDREKQWLRDLITEVEEGKDVSEKVWMLKKLRDMLDNM